MSEVTCCNVTVCMCVFVYSCFYFHYSRTWLIKQWSPMFLAPGTGNMEDNFSTDRGWGGGLFRR